MRTLVLVVAAALGVAVVTPAAAESACEKAPEIRAAFEPRLDYERARAIKATGENDEWPGEIQRDFDEISGEISGAKLDCRAVYDRYATYVDEVIARNDRLEKNSPMTRGLLFRKW